MTNTIVSRCYRSLSQAFYKQVHRMRERGQTRRWRREVLRSLRRRSRD